MRIHYSLLLIAVLLIIGCRDRSISVTGDFTDREIPYVVIIKDYRNQLFYELELSKEKPSTEITIKNKTVLEIAVDGWFIEKFVGPGSSLAILNEMGEIQITTDSYLNENHFLDDLPVKQEKAHYEFAESFKDEFTPDQYDHAYQKFLLSISPTSVERQRFDPIFNDLLEIRIKTLSAQKKVFRPYPSERQKSSKEKYFYYAITEEIEINDPDLLTWKSSRDYVKAVLLHGGENGWSKSISDPVENIKSVFEENNIREFLLFSQALMTITNSGGYASEYLPAKKYLDHLQHPYYRKEIRNELEEIMAVRPGSLAAEISAFDDQREEQKISSFKGKNVLIDLWFNGCGPCIAEKYYIKKLKEQYRDQNLEFVSICTDDLEDWDKWQKFIQLNQLDGHQWITGKKFKQELVENYKVRGYPRFLLIDKEGILVSAKMPKPSDPSIHRFLRDKIL